MLVATCGYAGAQTTTNAQPAAETGSMQTAPDTNLKLVTANARLMHTVDSSHAAQGQVVTAKLTTSTQAASGTELPKGTMLIGKVQQVQPASNNGPSRVSIIFDQARLPNGHSMPVKATLLGAYPADAADYWVDTSMKGSVMAVQPRTISANERVDQEPGTLGHIELHSAVRSNASGVFVDKDGNFKLKSGTYLQVAIAPMTRG